MFGLLFFYAVDESCGGALRHPAPFGRGTLRASGPSSGVPAPPTPWSWTFVAPGAGALTRSPASGRRKQRPPDSLGLRPYPQEASLSPPPAWLRCVRAPKKALMKSVLSPSREDKSSAIRFLFSFVVRKQIPSLSFPVPKPALQQNKHQAVPALPSLSYLTAQPPALQTFPLPPGRQPSGSNRRAFRTIPAGGPWAVRT